MTADLTGQVGGEDPLLYAAGTSMTLHRLGEVCSVAQWDGLEWTPIAACPDDGSVRRALVIDRPGSQPDELYVVGSFDGFDGQNIEGIARWDGEQWRPVGPAQHGSLVDAAVIDGAILGAAGNVILAVGAFNGADVAWWDGVNWQPLFELRGTPNLADAWTAVSYDDDGDSSTPSALHLAGDFDWIDSVSARGYERLACPDIGCYADFDADGSVDTADFIAFLNAWATQDPLADCDDSGGINTRDFVCFLNAWAAGC